MQDPFTYEHRRFRAYHAAESLSHWLSLKYGMSYKQYRNKSKNRRQELREEYEADIAYYRDYAGPHYNVNGLWMDEDDFDEILAEYGVPFDEDGDPVGI